MCSEYIGVCDSCGNTIYDRPDLRSYNYHKSNCKELMDNMSEKFSDPAFVNDKAKELPKNEVYSIELTELEITILQDALADASLQNIHDEKKFLDFSKLSSNITCQYIGHKFTIKEGD